MPLARRTNLKNMGPRHKSDDIKSLKDALKKAKQDLLGAQKRKDEKRIEFLQQSIANLTGTIERNS